MTGFRCAIIRILHFNSLLGSEDDNDMMGVFTSDDFRVASRYTSDVQYGTTGGGVIALNAAKIASAGFNIERYVYYEGADGDEYVITTEDLHPLHAMIERITIRRSDFAKIQNVISEDHHAYYIDYEWDDDSDLYEKAIAAALKFPYTLT